MKELQDVKAFVSTRAKDFRQLSGLDIYEKRIELIAEIYLKRNSDIDAAFEDFTTMYNQIKMEEASLLNELELNITFDDHAIDELIWKAIDTEQEAGALSFHLAKKLEYGLKLVRDRSGLENFKISREAVTDMEKYINDLMKRYYRKEYDPYYSDNLRSEESLATIQEKDLDKKK